MLWKQNSSEQKWKEQNPPFSLDEVRAQFKLKALPEDKRTIIGGKYLCDGLIVQENRPTLVGSSITHALYHKN